MPSQPTIKQPTRTRPKKSISRHPLFPVIAALWTGALLGLGSLAIPGWMIERAVLATQIDTVLPAAAPPLGMTARLLLALALFCAGAMIGLVATRGRVATAPVGESRRRVEPDLLDALEPESAAPRAFTEDRPRILDLDGLNGLEGLAATPPRLERHDVPATLLGSLRFDTPDDKSWHPASEDAQSAPAEAMIPDWAETLDPAAPLVDSPVPPVPACNAPPLAEVPETDAQTDIDPVPSPPSEEVQPPAVAPGTACAVDFANATPLGLVSADAATKLKATPLESLGVVELAERLALAISERRSRAVRDGAPSAQLPFQAEGQIAAARPRSGEGNGFGSLLDMAMPARCPRTEQAAGEAPAWSDSTPPPAVGDMQLQSALAKLQQVSGGA